MQYLYINGKYQSTTLDNVSSMAQAVNYGTAAFEGMKAFYLPEHENWFIFRPDQYYERLCRGTKMLDIDFQMSLDKFVSVISTLIRKNNEKVDTYIRPLVYRDQKGVGLMKPSGHGISIFSQPIPFSSANQYRCCFVTQRRPTDGTYSGKLTGNYLLSFFAHKEAVARGFDHGILLSTEGHVAEASIMNLFFVKTRKLLTPSLECGPLAGITRKSVLQLAKDELKVKTTEGKFLPSRLYEADEIFFTGTGSGVNYVKQLEKRSFELHRKNLLSSEIAALFDDVTHLRNKRYSDWLVPVK